MKKLSLSVLFIFATLIGFSQKSQVVSAFNYHRNGKLDKAKIAIDKATVNEKTIGMAKTWYYRGNIYLDIAQSPLEAYKNLDPDALSKAEEAYNKALELDKKKQYTEDILKRMPILGEAYFFDGANYYNLGSEAKKTGDTATAKKDYSRTLASFEKAYEIYNKYGAADSTKDMTLYYMSYAAELAGENDKAINYLTKLVNIDYPDPVIYVSLGNLYKDKGDNENAEKYFALGVQKYPDNLNVLLNQINLYLAIGETDKALANLEKAATLDATNPTIFFAIGTSYDKIVSDTTQTAEVRENAFNKAIEAYQKAIDLKDDYFDAYYNMGAIYVNKAAHLMDEANQLDLNAVDEYNALKEKADGFLSTSLPFLQKAHEIDPSDRNTMISLKEIYTRLKMYDKLKEINAELGM